MPYDNSNPPLFTKLKAQNVGEFRYRRGVILSELNTPCSPFFCEMILPEPLTIESISKIQKKPFLCLSYSSVLPCLPMLQEFSTKSKDNPNLKPFVDYEGAITLLTFNNFLSEGAKVENNEFVFHLDSSKFQLNEAKCREIIDLIKPSISVIPCELLKLNDRKSWSTRKRNRMNKQYENYYNNLLPCSNSTFLADTNHVALNFNKSDLPAIDLSGFGHGESLRERQEIISELMKGSKDDKLRILHLKCGTPLEVLQAVLLGVDVVVSQYPELQRRKGRAIHFYFPKEVNSEPDMDSVLKLLDEKCRFVEGVYKDQINDYLDLNDSVYSEQVHQKLHEESIREESRGYVNHLLVCNEMSASIILSSHNLWMYEMLFQKIRDSIENNTLLGFIHNFIELNVK